MNQLMTPNAYEKRILRVLDYIHDNPGGDLSLDKLADVAAMSRFHWHRVFHAMTGETCHDAVLRLRMYRAACWLLKKDWPVAKIALEVGYQNSQSFSRVFRKTFGFTPLQFRKRGVPVGRPRPDLKGHETVYTVEIDKTEDMRLAALAHRGPYMEIGHAFEKIFAIAESRGYWPNVRGVLAMYHDDPGAIAEAELRSHAAFILTPGADVPEGMDMLFVEGGDIARLRFKGPYAGLETAYKYLFGEWLATSGRDPADAPCYEIYLNSPMEVAPEDLLTDICVPLA